MKKSILIIIVIGIAAILRITDVLSQPVGYSFYKQVTIQSSQVSGAVNLVNFPVVLSVTDDDLRHTSSSGKIQHTLGYDILFTLDDCYTVLEHELESYDGTLGELVAWIKIPGLSPTSNTTIHLYYGNSTVVSDPSTSGVWALAYENIYHMNDDPSTGLVLDASINSRNAVTYGSWNASDRVPGQIGFALEFDGGGSGGDLDELIATTTSEPDATMTWSVWVNKDPGSPNWSGVLYDLAGINVDAVGYGNMVNNEVRFAMNNAWQTPTHLSVVDDSWTYIAVAVNGSSGATLYVGNNGSLSSFDYTQQFTAQANTTFRIGNQNCCGDRFFRGLIDEVRFVNSTRSSDWITTEYDNQYDPSSFFSIGAETVASGTGCGTADSTGPVVTLDTDNLATNINAFSVDIYFNEPIVELTLSDIDVINGTASNLTGGGTVFSVDIAALAEDTVRIQIPSGTVTDFFGNGNSASSELKVDYDLTGATATITTTVSNPTNSSTLPITITFDEPVTDFTGSNNDIYTSAGLGIVGFSAVDEMDGFATTFTFDLTVSTEGNHLIVVLEGNRSFDKAGNASNRTEFYFDTDYTGPSLTISSSESDPTEASTIPLSITFNEIVTGFEISDLTIVNGNAFNFSGSGTDYTISISPVSGGAITVDVASDIAQDLAGNGNLNAPQFSITSDQTTNMGYGYGKAVTINASQVSGSGPLSDFPILFTTIDNDLRSVSNGGKVQNNNGYDIMFTLGDCFTLLDHEIESYDPISGEFIAWVRIPSLDHSANTVINMYYGNATITSNPSSTGVWSGNYENVYHMNEDPSGSAPQITESTLNDRHASAQGSWNSGDLVGGQIGNALNFDGISEEDQLTAVSYGTSSVFTWTFWVNIPLQGAVRNLAPGIDVQSDNELRAGFSGNWNVPTGQIINANEWVYAAVVVDGINSSVYLGRSGTLTNHDYVQSFSPESFPIIQIGNLDNVCCTDRFIDGLIDETRLLSTALTADWIQTEYNNQFDPGAFYSIGLETTAAALGVCSSQTNASGGGNFSMPGTWTANQVPGSGDGITVNANDSIYLTQNVTVGSVDEIANGSVLNLNGYILSLDNGCINLSGTGHVNVSTSGSTVEYASGSDQCVTGMTYNHLELENTGNKTLNGPIVINGDLNIASSNVSLDVSNSDHQINIGGNWSNSGEFIERNGTVVFDGILTQTITNTSEQDTFNILHLNKMSNDVVLSSNVLINQGLILTNGDLVLNTRDLNMSQGGTITGGSPSSYIQAHSTGVVRSFVALSDSLVIPLGDSDEFSPFTLVLNDGNLGIDAAVTMNVTDGIYSGISGSSYISRYWTVNQENVSGSIDYNVYYQYTDADVVGSESSIQASKFSFAGNAQGGSINTTENTITYLGHTSFSTHTGEGDDPLPVELISFSGNYENDVVKLEWTTASELNNDQFVILRGSEPGYLNEIGRVSGHGTTNNVNDYQFKDRYPLDGESYYQLKQLDYDGQFELSHIVTVNNRMPGSTSVVTLYPNPTPQNNVHLFLDRSEGTPQLIISIVDQTGRLISYRLQRINAGHFLLQLQENISGGMYFVTLHIGQEIKKVKLIIE